MSGKILAAIDIGNTHIVTGLLKEDRQLLDTERMAADRDLSAVSYEKMLRALLERQGLQAEDLQGAAMSSVVPEVNEAVREGTRRVLGREPMLLEDVRGLDLHIETEHPEKVGKDMLADAAGALEEYSGDLIIFDLGTATTCSVVTADRRYLGHLIIPGMMTSSHALAEKASQLPEIRPEIPARLIGKNTVESMQSGLIHGTAAMVDGLIDRVEEELGHPATAVATGGLAALIAPCCRRKLTVDPELLLKGLWYLYQRNESR